MRAWQFLAQIVLATLVAVAGCGNKELPPVTATDSPSPIGQITLAPPSPTKLEVADYPPPAEQQSPAYPAPSQYATAAPSTPAIRYSAVTPIPVTPVSGRGAVTGLVIRHLAGVPVGPIAEIRLFLAKVITDEDAPLKVARLNEESAPSSLTNTEGQFVFVNVEPGKYALILELPMGAMLAHDEVADRDVIVDVVADEVVELGEVSLEIPH